jgi:hypothetical protein
MKFFEKLMIEEYLKEDVLKTKGWTKQSLKKFGETIGIDPTEKGFFNACVLKMKGKDGFDEEKAQKFCASIKDAAFDSPMWRGKDKTEKEVKKDVKKIKFKKKLS